MGEAGIWKNLCSPPSQNTQYPVTTKSVHSSFPETPCCHKLSDKITSVTFDDLNRERHRITNLMNLLHRQTPQQLLICPSQKAPSRHIPR